jgi:hypothetical protein
MAGRQSSNLLEIASSVSLLRNDEKTFRININISIKKTLKFLFRICNHENKILSMVSENNSENRKQQEDKQFSKP